MVRAWASENRLVWGQLKVDDKSNEISAVPQLLDMIDISGCIVTADALNCQKKMAQKVLDKEADYMLAVKDNQRNLHEAIQELQEKTAKGGIKAKRLRAGWDQDYLLKVLAG